MNSNLILSILIGYLLGSIPFTQIVAKVIKGIDLREVGSRNVGGRNLIRSVGPGWGLTGGILDGLKGMAAMILAGTLSVSIPLSFYVGVAAVAGHNWPIWLRFQGGKGLATALGVALWMMPVQALVSLAVALIVLKLTGNILLTSLSSFTALFVSIQIMLANSQFHWLAWGLFIVVLFASIPDILHKLRVSGGVREYMRNPNKVYESEGKK